MNSYFREVTEQHPHQLQQHPHQLDVDLPNGLKINGAMMKTITLTATGMEALVVTMLLEDGTHTAQVFEMSILSIRENNWSIRLYFH